MDKFYFVFFIILFNCLVGFESKKEVLSVYLSKDSKKSFNEFLINSNQINRNFIEKEASLMVYSENPDGNIGQKNFDKNDFKCPCGSKNLYGCRTFYDECCGFFHEKKVLPKNAFDVMRSRFSAYAMNLPDYIIQTTHLCNPQFCYDQVQWSKQISDFCSKTKFKNFYFSHTFP